MLRFEDVSTKDYPKAYNVYRGEWGLPVGIIRLHWTTKKLLFETLFNWLLPDSQEMTEIAKFMVEHE